MRRFNVSVIKKIHIKHMPVCLSS